MQLRELYVPADSLVTTSYTVAHGDVHPASNGVSAAPELDIPDREDGLKFHSRENARTVCHRAGVLDSR